VLGANFAANDQGGAAGSDSAGTAETADWATLMAGVARDLHEHHDDVDETLAAVTAVALEVVPGVDFACVTVASKPTAVASRGATDPAAEKINEIQQALGEGPCLTALWDSPLVRAEHSRGDSPWPAYSRAALELGICESVSVRLYVKDHVLGALSLYARRSGALTDESVEAARVYAAHAAVALFAAEQEANLTVAIDRRDTIGQAKGILMERFKLTDGQAFGLLVKVSQNTNTPMRTLVDKLTKTGVVPGLPDAP
jgi:GAF domain-containing protein